MFILQHVCFFKLKAADVKPHFIAVHRHIWMYRHFLFENLTSVRANAQAQMFRWSKDRQFSRLFFFPPHTNLLDHFTKDGLCFIQSFIITYSSSEKFSFCLSHTDKFTKVPCSLVDSCVGDGCDGGSLMFLVVTYLERTKCREWWTFAFVYFTSLIMTQLYCSWGWIMSTPLN